MLIWKKLLVLFFVIAIITGCGKKVVKTDWTSQQYLDYAIELFNKEKYIKAQNELNFITIQFAGTPIMDKARLYLAKTYYHTHEYLVAISEFNRLIQEMSESPLVSEAQFNIGICYRKMSPLAQLDQEYTKKAIREFQLFIETFPQDEKVKEADKYIFELRKKLAKKDLNAANLYKRNKNYTAAIVYYQNLLDNYYDLDMAEDALFKKGECQKKINKFEESQKTFNAYIGKYPEGKYINKAKQLIGKLQEELNKTGEEEK
ncbi:MAG: outer membrane protein assembly factor BamD [Calditrichia bacterium]|nr:outer membrane protein assembly factor BamD [Calditrichia bacterium]